MFGVFVADHGSTFQEGTKSSLYKQVRYWSCTPNDLKAWQKCSRKGDWLGTEVKYPSAAQSSKKSQWQLAVALSNTYFKWFSWN